MFTLSLSFTPPSYLYPITFTPSPFTHQLNPPPPHSAEAVGPDLDLWGTGGTRSERERDRDRDSMGSEKMGRRASGEGSMLLAGMGSRGSMGRMGMGPPKRRYQVGEGGRVKGEE